MSDQINNVSVVGFLPPPGTGFPFERPHNILGDPTPVEVSWLGDHQFAIYPAFVHFGRIESHIVFNGHKRGCGVIIIPGGIFNFFPIYLKMVITTFTFPFAISAMRRRDEERGFNIRRWEVIARRMTGFQYAITLRSIGDLFSVEYHY